MDRRALEEQRDFLLRSLSDLEEERRAGDIAEADFVALRDRYTARAATVLRQLQETGTAAGVLPGAGVATLVGGADAAPAQAAARAGAEQTSAAGAEQTSAAGAPPAAGHAPPGKTGRRHRWRRRRAVLGAGLVLVLAGVGLLAALLIAKPLLPGQTVTGSVQLNSGQKVKRELEQAITLESLGQEAEALPLYQEVLKVRPHQPVALAESGWIEFSSGVESHHALLVQRGQQEELLAVKVSPAAWGPRLYLASMYLTENDPADAVTQFRAMLANKPPAAKVQAAMGLITKAFAAVHQPLPPLPAGVSATSGTTTRGTSGTPASGTPASSPPKTPASSSPAP